MVINFLDFLTNQRPWEKQEEKRLMRAGRYFFLRKFLNYFYHGDYAIGNVADEIEQRRRTGEFELLTIADLYKLSNHVQGLPFCKEKLIFEILRKTCCSYSQLASLQLSEVRYKMVKPTFVFEMNGDEVNIGEDLIDDLWKKIINRIDFTDEVREIFVSAGAQGLTEQEISSMIDQLFNDANIASTASEMALRNALAAHQQEERCDISFRRPFFNELEKKNFIDFFSMM